MTADLAIDHPAPGTFRVDAAPHPFKTGRVDFELEEGHTLEDILVACQADPILRRHAHISVGDVYVPRELWRRVRPKAGARVAVRVVPTGGGGGDKNPVRTVLTIAVIAASIAVPALMASMPSLAAGLGNLGLAVGASAGSAIAVGGAIVGGAISVAGAMLVNAIAPPSRPKLGSLSGGGSAAFDSPTLFVTGTQNRANPFGVIPRPLGESRMVPPYGAKPYTEVVGNDQFFRALFVWGYGPLEISELKFGETPIADLEEVEVETVQGYDSDDPLSLFPNSVSEESLSVVLEGPSTWSTRTSGTDADELSVDISFPQGLVQFSSTGDKLLRTITVEVEYSPAGAGSWTSAGTLDISANKTNAVRRGLRWKVDRGQYDVRVRRVTAPSSLDTQQDVTVWSALRTITNEDPVVEPGLAKTAIRIKRSDQLQGVIDQLNGVVRSILPDYDSGSGTWVERATSNPASIYRAVLNERGNARPVGVSRCDLDRLATWHGQCVAAGRRFDHVVDYQATVPEILEDVAAAGRARRSMSGNKWSVVVDAPQSTPVQHFTPRNSWGYKGRRVYPEDLHAWRIRFVNREKQWQQDERLVYDDGFDESNATKIEGLELVGVTDPDQVWKDGRYHLAVSRLRPETHTFYCDIEHIVAERGDLIRFSHDVPKVGLGSGRVKSRVVDDPDTPTECSAVTLDEPVPMELGTDYGIRFRLASGASTVANLVNDPGDQLTVTFETPIPIASAPAAGDLAMFGERDVESIELIIRDILPGPDMSAQIRAVNYSPGVFDADTGTIPAFTSVVTDLAAAEVPAITAIRSDESVLIRDSDGSFRPRVLVEFGLASRRDAKATALEVQYRPSGFSGGWQSITRAASAVSVSIEDVEEGDELELRARFLTDRAPGPWSATHSETVIGTGTPPDAPTGLYEERTGGRRFARWRYDAPPRDFAGFRVKHRAGAKAKWSDATAAHDGLLETPEFDLARIPAGTRAVMVKAVDVSGHESTTFASILLGLGDPVVANVIVTEDLAADGFPGTITNASVAGGALEADDNGSLYLATDDAPYLADGSALYLPVTYKAVTYEFTVTPDYDATPSDLTVAATVAAETWSLEVRRRAEGLYLPDDDALYLEEGSALYLGGPSAWRSWPGALEDVGREPFDFRISLAGGATQGRVTALAAKLDVDDVEERLTDVAIAAGGTRLPIASSFRTITSVEDATLTDSGDAVAIRVRDKSTAGPLVVALDAAGAETAGTLNSVTVKGY